MIKKILKVAGVILLLIILVAIPLIVTLYRDPGFYLRLVSEKISEDQATEVSYNYDFDDTSKIKRVPYLYFVPSESGNYTFNAADLESSSEVSGIEIIPSFSFYKLFMYRNLLNAIIHFRYYLERKMPTWMYRT